MLCDLWFACDDFSEALPGGSPLLTDAERSHMRDVSRLLRLLLVVWAVAAVVALAAALLLRRSRRVVGIALVASGAAVGSLAVVLAAIFAVAFDQAFLAFHELFFPQGNFLFGPDSNLLRLFPEGFWFDAALTAGIAIIGFALAATLVGWRLWRRGRGDMAGR
jgi:integral membrane protein (TIGR01906 family)